MASATENQNNIGAPKIQYYYYSKKKFNPQLTNVNNLKLRKKKIMIVLIVGGTSLLEIACFRLLSEDPNFPFSIIIASTKIITGNSLLKLLYHD